MDGKKLTETIMALAAVDPVKLWEGIVSRFEEIVQNRSEAPPELVRLRDHPWIIHWQLDEIDLLLYRHPSRMEHYDKAER